MPMAEKHSRIIVISDSEDDEQLEENLILKLQMENRLLTASLGPYIVRLEAG